MGYGFLIIFVITSFVMEVSKMSIDFWLKDFINQEESFFADLTGYFGSF